MENPSDRMASSACSIWRRMDSVTGVPYGMREERQGLAGLFYVGRPIQRLKTRMDDFSKSARSNGWTTFHSRAACNPGRISDRSEALKPSANTISFSRAIGASFANNSSLQKKQRLDGLER